MSTPVKVRVDNVELGEEDSLLSDEVDLAPIWVQYVPAPAVDVAQQSCNTRSVTERMGQCTAAF